MWMDEGMNIMDEIVANLDGWTWARGSINDWRTMWSDEWSSNECGWMDRVWIGEWMDNANVCMDNVDGWMEKCW